MKKFISYFIIYIGCFAFLSGCASYPDLSDEDMDLVAEYAAGLLLKHSEKADNRLIKVEDAITLVEKEEEKNQEIKEPEEDKKPEEVEPDKKEEINTPVKDNSEQEVIAQSPINEVFGYEGISIAINGYEIKESYPDGSGAFFALDAAEGNKLIVLKLILSNEGAENVEIDMLSSSCQFKISLDGNGYKHAMSTMLLDDMSTYVGSVSPGTSVELVLISEWKMDDVNNISDLTLYMKNGELSGKYHIE